MMRVELHLARGMGVCSPRKFYMLRGCFCGFWGPKSAGNYIDSYPYIFYEISISANFSVYIASWSYLPVSQVYTPMT